MGISKSIGFSMDIVGLDEIRRLNPFLTTETCMAAAWTRDDGHGDPSGLCNALAKAARDLGATVVRHNRVTDIAARAAASGRWSPRRAPSSPRWSSMPPAATRARSPQWSGADAPITNMQHHYVDHASGAGFPRAQRRDSGDARFLHVRLFPPGAKIRADRGSTRARGLTEAWAPRGHPEWESSNELFPDDLDRIAPWLERAIERMPIFGDGRHSPRHQRRDSAHAGRRAAARARRPGCGISGCAAAPRSALRRAAAAASILAQWMIHGDAEINMTEFDPRRFGPLRTNVRAREGVPGLPPTFTTRLPGEEEPARRGPTR